MKLFLIRHAHAGSRKSDDRHDIYRQLSERGRGQSLRIADALEGIDVGAVISSPATRCVQTVEPLAARLGLEVREDERLWEDSEIPESIRLLDEHAATGAVLCSHGNIIPDMLHWLMEGGMATKGRGCAKGSVWTITHDGSRYSRARYRHVDDLPL